MEDTEVQKIRMLLNSMEDVKLKECWVLVEDCCRLLPSKHEKSTYPSVLKKRPKHEKDYLSSSDTSNDFAEANTDDAQDLYFRKFQKSFGTNPCGTSSPSDKIALSKFKKVKKPQSLGKSHRKRGSGSGNPSTANLAKRHLLQKYGSSLLRKPTFSIKVFDSSSSIAAKCSNPDKIAGCEASASTVSGEVSAIKQSDNTSLAMSNEIIVQSQLSKLARERANGGNSLCQVKNRSESEEGTPTPKSLAASIVQLREKFSFKGTSQNYANASSSSGLQEDSSKSPCDMEKDAPCCNLMNTEPSRKVKEVIMALPSSVKTEDAVLMEDNQFYSNPSHPMPAVGMAVCPGVGLQLALLQAKCVLTCLDDCRDSITPQFAQFSATTVMNPSSKQSTKPVVLPITDSRILQLMEVKWKSRSVLNKIPITHLSCMNRKGYLKSTARGATLRSRQLRKRSASNGELYPNMHVKKQRQNLASCPQIIKSESDQQGKNSVQGTLHCSSMSSNDKTHGPTSENCQKKNVSGTKLKSKKESEVEPGRSQKHSTNDGNVSDSSSLSISDIVKVDSKEHTPKRRVKFTLLATDKGKSSPMITSSDSEKIPTKDSTILRSLVDFPEPSYDPDDTRGIPGDGSEKYVEEKTNVCRKRPSHLMQELRRLNVAVFDMTDEIESTKCKLPDVCRLGCVCSSLAAIVVRDNCALEKCMFECTCPKASMTCSKEIKDHPFTWVENKAKANLAKVERQFKQTVVCSGKDDLFLVEGRKKREIKLPERYRQIVPDSDLQAVRQFGALKSLTSAEPLPVDKGNCDGEQSEASASGKTKRSPIVDKAEKDHVDSSSMDSYNSNSVSLPRTDEEVFSASEDELHPSYSDPGTSARTLIYNYIRRTSIQRNENEFSNYSAIGPTDEVGRKKIPSLISVNEGSRHDIVHKTVINADSSCSVIFTPEFIKTKEKDVVVLSCEALRKDIDEENVHLWLKTVGLKPKIYISNKCVPPSKGCLELQAIDLSREEFKTLPFNLKTLRSDYSLSDGEKKCRWIVKHQKCYWVIVGFMEPGQSSNLSGEIVEVDGGTSNLRASRYRWWVMDLNQNFDLIFFLNFKKAITKDQLSTLLKLSNEYAEEGENKVHRILVSRKRPNLDTEATGFPDFGAYSLPYHPTEFLIGPYDPCGEPRFQVYMKKVAHNGKSQFENVPLYYCGGGGECVRVNSNGALSLHIEDLPENCVQGTWYHSFENGISDLDLEEQIALKARSEKTYLHPEVVDLTEVDPSSTQNKESADIEPSSLRNLETLRRGIEVYPSEETLCNSTLKSENYEKNLKDRERSLTEESENSGSDSDELSSDESDLINKKKFERSHDEGLGSLEEDRELRKVSVIRSVHQRKEGRTRTIAHAQKVMKGGTGCSVTSCAGTVRLLVSPLSSSERTVNASICV